jgi:hypothetical protein
MTETQEQQEERIRRHLIETQARIEQDVQATTDITMKRIEVDAATVVTLSLVAELLPTTLQEHVHSIINLHSEVWNMDTLSLMHSTPRIPLGKRLIQRFTSRE